MSRRWLTLCLIFTTAAGPWLCCCTATQLAALLPRAEAAVSPPATCCCCDASTESESSLDQPGQRPGEHHCPCQEKRATCETVAALRPSTSGFESLDFNSVDASVHLVVRLATADGAATVAAGTVAVSVQVPFSRNHILRC